MDGRTRSRCARRSPSAPDSSSCRRWRRASCRPRRSPRPSVFRLVEAELGRGVRVRACRVPLQPDRDRARGPRDDPHGLGDGLAFVTTLDAPATRWTHARGEVELHARAHRRHGNGALHRLDRPSGSPGRDHGGANRGRAGTAVRARHEHDPHARGRLVADRDEPVPAAALGLVQRLRRRAPGGRPSDPPGAHSARPIEHDWPSGVSVARVARARPRLGERAVRKARRRTRRHRSARACPPASAPSARLRPRS